MLSKLFSVIIGSSDKAKMSKLTPDEIAYLWWHLISISRPMLPYMGFSEVRDQFPIKESDELDDGLFPRTECLDIKPWGEDKDKDRYTGRYLLLTSNGDLYLLFRTAKKSMWKVKHIAYTDDLKPLIIEKGFRKSSLPDILNASVPSVVAEAEKIIKANSDFRATCNRLDFE